MTLFFFKLNNIIAIASIFGKHFVIYLIFITPVNLINFKTFQNSGNDSRLAIERNPKTCLMTEQDSNTGDNPWWHMETDKIYKITELSIISSPGYLQQGRMNIMSNEECRNYLADSVATKDALNYKNILDINTLFCAGSIPTLHGITICNVIQKN